MDPKAPFTDQISISLRRRPQGDKTGLVEIVRWVALTALFLLLILVITNLLLGYLLNALIIALGLLPILASIILLKRDAITIPTTLLASTTILLITLQATYGQGLYDIGVLGFPVILIVAGLILRGRAIFAITTFTIACLGWLAFGAVQGLYTPTPPSSGNIQDFFIGAIILLVAGNAMHRLTNRVYKSLDKADEEIANRKKAEIEREALIGRLKSKNQELDRFAIRVSHDLKSPLITLAGFLGLLDKDMRAGKQDQVEKDLTQINEAAKKMGQFVDELLDLSRVGRIINPPKTVPFSAIVQDALKATDGLLKAKQVQVRVDADYPSVHVDLPRIVQVLQNLIVNAVKFMGEQTDPVIQIGHEISADEVVFFVRDNGIGIAPEYHEQIFELFNKLNPDIEGTGLGLGLVKRIVEVHQGRIWVESTLGKGATFRFTLGPPVQKS